MAGTPAPGSLDAVRAAPEGLDRYRAAVEYIDRAENRAKDGRKIRDEEVRKLHAKHGTAETQRLTGLSPATIKTIVRPR